MKSGAGQVASLWRVVSRTSGASPLPLCKAGFTFGALATFGAILFGATTQTWEMSSYQDFMRGRFSGLRAPIAIARLLP